MNRCRVFLSLIAVLALGWLVYNHLTAEHYIYVNKTDDLSDADAVQLSIRSAQLRTGIQFAVVELPSLPENQNIQTAAAETFRALKLGAQTDDRAVLLYYIAEPASLKIEVSQRLEGSMTDVMTNRMEAAARTNMLKNRRADFLSELMITLCLLYEKNDVAASLDALSVGQPYLTKLYNAGGGAIGRGYAATTDQAKKETALMPSLAADKYMAARSPDAVVSRYLISLEAGIGDPNLPLLSESSRLYRLESPQNTGQVQRNARYYSMAQPYRLLQDGESAYALFTSAYPVLPIVLSKDADGLWHIEEGRMQSLFQRFEDSNRIFERYPLPLVHQEVLHRQAPVVPHAHNGSVTKALHDLEQRHQQGDLSATIALAERLYLDLYWQAAALPLYEHAIAADDHTYAAYRWRLLDGYLMTSDIKRYLQTWDQLACIYSDDTDLGLQRQFYHDTYDFTNLHWSQTMKNWRSAYGGLWQLIPTLWYQKILCPVLKPDLTAMIFP